MNALFRMLLISTTAFGFLFFEAAAADVPKFGLYEAELKASGSYVNPYLECEAQATLTEPDGTTVRKVPLFWHDAAVWKFRFSPDNTGEWKWTVQSKDAGLNEKSGSFRVANSERKGSIRPMRDYPHHFERQDGSRFWFLGDTAWALFTDKAEEKHDREAAMRYLEARTSQGFNVVHSTLLSEAGWGNRAGMPFTEISAEKINPTYWQEVDERLAYANSKGLVCGLAVAWGDKQKKEPFAWRKFPSVEARKRYARYIAARYSAYDVYFIVAGEWHGEVHTRPSTEAEVKKEFIEIGKVMADADPHDRMMAMHPMTSHGSVREFNDAKWMSFGDYQQNYQDLHARLLQSRALRKPVVNSEYGYFLRDQSGDGVPDKDNSTSLASMRHASWDIVMAGGYLVTGFGTTYFGGNRDPGPFDLDAARNDDWEKQLAIMKEAFTRREWWKLEPHDALLTSGTARGKDGRELRVIAPPATTYWCLAERGRQYMIYGRGLNEPVTLSIQGGAAGWRQEELDPRSGQTKESAAEVEDGRFTYRPPDEKDWVVFLFRAR
jgi:hypothetical protein